MGSIYSAIDIGTNSVLLLVAEVAEGRRLRVLEEAERITCLGRELTRTGQLQAAAIQGTVAAVLELVQIAKRAGASRTLLAGTSALRDATNGRELALLLERATGLTLRILSGTEEGEVTFLGVATDPVLAQKALRVIDSGGGSTEIIQGREGKIVALTSIDIGHVRLTERFLTSDPPSQGQVARLMEHVRTELSRACVSMCQPGEVLVGVGGTVTTLAAIDQGLSRYEATGVDGHVLSQERLRRLREELQALPLAERVKVRGLDPRRAPVIVAGTAVWEVLMAELRFAQVRVTARGLRHGLLLMESRAPEKGL